MISGPAYGMRSRNSLILPLVFFAMAPACLGGTFAVLGPQSGSWPTVLSSVGHVPGPAASADIFIAPPGTPTAVDWKKKIEGGAALILEGSSPLAGSFGFRALAGTVSVIHLVDV